MKPSRSIRSRILAAFVLSLAAFVGALGYGLTQLQAIGHGIEVIDSGYLPLARVATDLEAVVRQMDREYARLTRDQPRPIAGHRSNAVFYISSLEQGIERGKQTAMDSHARIEDPMERVALEIVLTHLEELERQRLSFELAVLQWVDSGETPEATVLKDNSSSTPPGTAALVEVQLHRKRLASQVAQLSALVEERIQSVSTRTARAQSRATTVSGALAALAVILAGVMAGVALLTLRPIGELIEQVQRLAAGDY
ncbi:MAG: hypothetical protein QGG40_17705, partial [Myxococcota bacterium]|nr:hypothetical protein [Myxococcota bacterium]